MIGYITVINLVNDLLYIILFLFYFFLILLVQYSFYIVLTNFFFFNLFTIIQILITYCKLLIVN